MSQQSSGNHEVILTVAEELKKARAISEIESDSFVQKEFHTNYNKTNQDIVEGSFEFGTSAEVKSKSDALNTLNKINRDGLFNPMFFGDQAAREKRFLQHVWTIRSKHIKTLKSQS